MIAFFYHWPSDSLKVMVSIEPGARTMAEAPWAAWLAWWAKLSSGMPIGHCENGHSIFPLPGTEGIHLDPRGEDGFARCMVEILETAQEMRNQGSKPWLMMTAATVATEPMCLVPIADLFTWRQLV